MLISKYKAVSVLLFLLFILISKSSAFDGRRKGFILGAGIGVDLSFFDEVDTFGPVGGAGSGNSLGWNGDLLIGYSTPKVSIYTAYSRTAFTSSKPLQDEEGYPVGDETPEGIHFLSVGTNIYFSKNPRQSFNPYFTGRFGEMLQFVSTTSSNVYEGRSVAFSVGVGLEYSRHFSFELRYLKGSPEEANRSLDFSSIQVVFCAVAY